MAQDTILVKVDLVALTKRIVAAYICRNHIAATDLPTLLKSVHETLIKINDVGTLATTPQKFRVEKLSVAQIRNSVHPDGLTSYINGKAYKTLRRHLTSHGLSPQSYRELFGLPADYPMVASNYAKYRSALAKSISLGRVDAQNLDR